MTAIISLVSLLCMACADEPLPVENDKMNHDYIVISQQLLQAVRLGEPADSLVNLLSLANEQHLLQQLDNDGKRKAFWINLYNAYTQYLLSQNPGLFNERNAFFSDKRFTIAGNELSLDDVEHGILRRNKVKWSLGYLGKWFPRKFNKRFEVDSLDARIHFTLNCGAKSCPPIAFYDPDRIEQQMQLARRAYMKSQTVISADSSRVEVPKILQWFKGDFGGDKGIYKMLWELQIIPENSKPKIEYLPYDWTLMTKAF